MLGEAPPAFGVEGAVGDAVPRKDPGDGLCPGHETADKAQRLRGMIGGLERDGCRPWCDRVVHFFPHRICGAACGEPPDSMHSLICMIVLDLESPRCCSK